MPNDREPGPSSNSGSLPDPSPIARRALRLAGYNALSAAILLILIELGLRLFGFEFTLEPPRVEFGFPKQIGVGNDLFPDPDLLWVPPGYMAKVASAQEARSRPSVVFMGDSTTQGRYESELQSIIQERHPGSDFTYVTLGVTGWSSWSGLQQLQRDVLPIRPRAVTINYGWNDHWNYYNLQDKDAARFLDPERFFRRPAFFSRFRTVQLVNKALLALGQRLAEASQARVSPDDFRSNLRRMVLIARDNGIIPILFTAPSSHRRGQEPAYLAERWLTDIEELVPLHRQYVRIVREVAAAENATLVDLHHEFDQLSRQDLKRFFYRDGIHLKRAGHRKIAELIDQVLDQEGLYPQILAP